MLARGVRKRCPRCGTGHLFRSWFKMRDRCPGCGYLFDLGVLIFKEATGHVGAWWPYILVAAITQVTVPLIFYPFSKTIWAAFDLLVMPLDAVDEAEAIVAAADQRRSE